MVIYKVPARETRLKIHLRLSLPSPRFSGVFSFSRTLNFYTLHTPPPQPHPSKSNPRSKNWMGEECRFCVCLNLIRRRRYSSNRGKRVNNVTSSCEREKCLKLWNDKRNIHTSYQNKNKTEKKKRRPYLENWDMFRTFVAPYRRLLELSSYFPFWCQRDILQHSEAVHVCKRTKALTYFYPIYWHVCIRKENVFGENFQKQRKKLWQSKFPGKRLIS